jgi:hypothetical protein
MSHFPKSTLHIYHDCLRTIQHFAGNSSKGHAIRSLVRQEFRKHTKENNPEQIERLKQNAATSLANYLALQNIAKVTEAKSSSFKIQSTHGHMSGNGIEETKKVEKERRLTQLREQAELLRKKWKEEQGNK